MNVLIALIDKTHIASDAAHDWFQRHGRACWATCPITEAGVLRIVGSLAYANSAGSPANVAPALVSLRQQGDHAFWPADISLMDSSIVTSEALLVSKQITDTYLLALAVRRGGALATLDRRLSPTAVEGGKAALHFIG